MCSIQDCEREWILGRRGFCNETLEICICPEGFSGVDDWKVFSSCNVNESLRQGIHILALTASAIDVVLMLVSLIWFSTREGFTPDPLPRRNSKEISKETNTQSSPRLNLLRPPGMRRGSSPYRYRLQRRIWRRKRGSLLSMALFFLFSVFSFLYYLPFVVSTDEYPNGIRRFDLDAEETINAFAFIQSFSLAAAASFMISGFFYSLVAWYNTLPSVRRYGALLKMNRLLVRYPKLVYQVSNTCIAIGSLSSFLSVFIFPLVSSRLKTVGDKLFLAVIMFCIIVFYVLLNIVVFSVRAIQREYLKSLELDGDAESRSMQQETFFAFKNGIRNATCLIYLSHIGITLALIAVTIIYLPAGERYLYIVFNLLVIVAHLASIVLVIISAFCTSGGGAPLERKKTNSKVSREEETPPVAKKNIETQELYISESEVLNTAEIRAQDENRLQEDKEV